ncbi:flagellin [Sulfuricurvum sp.]|uniref:flagellin n=1 Tax=Sulfuricurvum sp. TaxID=2025608 RepID=UPI002607A692|nr:flagellin [Sulfuricurvum sp.]MDD4885010.1 flagellin [Sulfuricurvum sp.]
MKIDTQYNTLPQMNAESSKRDKTLEKIAAATELSMQDSASRTIADMLQNEISTISQGVMNANDGISMMQISSGTLNSLSDQTQTLNDLSVRYNSASLNDTQKQALQSEFNRTTESMQQSINSTTFNGQALFGSNLSFSLGNSTVSTSLSGISTGSLSIDSQESIQSFSDTLTQARSDVGSTTNALVSSSNALLDQISAASAAKSQIADTDLAKAITDFQQSNSKLNTAQIAMVHQQDALRQTIGRLLG